LSVRQVTSALEERLVRALEGVQLARTRTDRLQHRVDLAQEDLSAPGQLWRLPCHVQPAFRAQHKVSVPQTRSVQRATIAWLGLLETILLLTAIFPTFLTSAHSGLIAGQACAQGLCFDMPTQVLQLLARMAQFVAKARPILVAWVPAQLDHSAQLLGTLVFHAHRGIIAPAEETLLLTSVQEAPSTCTLGSKTALLALLGASAL